MLLLKTLGVILLSILLIPLGLFILCIIPILVGNLFPNPLIGFGVCLLILISEMIGILYYLENHKGNKNV